MVGLDDDLAGCGLIKRGPIKLQGIGLISVGARRNRRNPLEFYRHRQTILPLGAFALRINLKRDFRYREVFLF
jgi:hypothetical protein